MRKHRRFAAILTAGLLAVTPCVSAGMAFATEDPATPPAVEPATGTKELTITDADPNEHTYQAYQIILGKQATVDGEKVLKELKWGPGFDSASFITKLNANKTALGISSETANLAANASVQTVAEFLAKVTTPAAKNKLAKIVQECISGCPTISLDSSVTSTGTSYTTDDLADGWYLIIDATDPLVTGDVAATDEGVRVKSANMLRLVDDTTINAKHSLPTLDKKITDSTGANPVTANTAAIGDSVYYTINITVPDVRGYDKYYYVVEDTLSSGLTYNEDLIVKLNGTTVLDPDEDGSSTDTADEGAYYVTHTGTSIKVVFEDAVNFFSDKTPGQPMQIIYSATVNSDAVIGDAGNPNDAKLVYSNNPNAVTDGTHKPGTPDEPKDDGPTGVTPKITVTTYTTAIKLHKVDQDKHNLAGAKFQLISNALNEVKVTSAETFVEDTEGTYYKLKDGSYTTTEPTDSTKAQYDNNGTTKYSKTKTAGSYTEKATGEDLCVEAEVDSNGIITFAGLKPGTYTLHESKVPDGYNASDDITFTIEANDPVTGPSEWSISGITKNYADNAFNVEIENRKGTTLPSTGGIGTKLFYLFGGLLAIGSGVVLVTKKRMANIEK